MVCAGLETIASNSIVGILAFPTSCDYQFWAKIMFSFLIIIALTLYFNDKRQLRKADFLSSLGVSGLLTIFITFIGTLVGERLDDGTWLTIIQPDIFTEIFVVCIIFVVIWLLKRD